MVGLLLRSVRVFRQFLRLEAGSVKMALSRPTHQRVTPAVRRLLLESSTTLFINFLVDLAGSAILKEVIRTSTYQQAYHLFFDDTAGSILLA